ncbi:restriction modification system DNA specificity subunit [Alteromonas mediterranea 615]|uniref:Restriction modification system DNA specificity subunit n=1 Tax=Alteromonas mediterranea 615 TaxID=1300253 RepID=S5APL4_9ALTE|nr:restriction modification system DNA specificity subunit [Alteromonas mediterranea 615]
MTSIAEWPTYKTNKNSGVEKIGHIPDFWEVNKLKFVTSINSETLPENTSSSLPLDYVDIGSVSFENGIEKTERYVFKDAPSRARRRARSGDVVISTVRTYLKAMACVDDDASRYTYSTGFAVITPKKDLISTFLGYFVKSNAFTEQVDMVAKGMSYPAINSSELSNLYLVLPPVEDQILIAKFLDKTVEQIDEAIMLKKKQIERLKERKQIIVQQAVSKGLDPNVAMKDSGIDWIGRIPNHWTVKKAKYLFNEVDERSVAGEEELLSVSHITGVTPRSEKNVSMFMAEDYSGSKLCKKNDLVINIMWAWMGALGVSNQTGIVSPSYGVYRQKRKNLFNPVYLEYLLKTTKYIEYYNKVSTGLHSSRLRFYGHMFFAMKLGFPDFDEQNSIVSYLEEKTTKIDQALAVQNSQIDKLKEYKATLIHNAVTGKIKVA